MVFNKSNKPKGELSQSFDHLRTDIACPLKDILAVRVSYYLLGCFYCCCYGRKTFNCCVSVGCSLKSFYNTHVLRLSYTR